MTWLNWTKFAIMPGLLILIAIPFIVRLVSPTKTKDLGDLQSQAVENYNQLGKLSKNEKYIISTLSLMLLMWIFGDTIHVPILVTTLLGVCILYCLDIIKIKDILSHYGTFNSVMMIGIIISYVNCLNSLGAIEWFNSVVTSWISVFDAKIAFVAMSMIYFLAHYFFTGEGSRIIALYASFLSIGIGLGIETLDVAMTLAVFSSISSILTNYSGPVAILMYSTGYVHSKKWFLNGIILAIVVMTIWFGCLFMR